jgi:hypothetical protein
MIGPNWVGSIIDIGVIERVQAAGDTENGATQRKDADADGQHRLAEGFHHAGIVARGAHEPTGDEASVVEFADRLHRKRGGRSTAAH